MLVTITDDYDALSKAAAQQVASLIRRKPDSVIGFATGSTPVGLYKELIRLHENEGLDFSKITCFNLDEYVGLSPSHEQSYNYFMWTTLFNHINVNPSAVYLPMSLAEDVDAFCEWYEEKIIEAGGLDLQILGIGGNGHIAFNEPGSSLGSRTRIKTLSETTRRDNARFFGTLDQVPQYAITMGVGTIMEARRLLLMASGESKAEAIAATVEGPIMAKFPATIVQLHRFAHIIVDREAASKLTEQHDSL